MSRSKRKNRGGRKDRDGRPRRGEKGETPVKETSREPEAPADSAEVPEDPNAEPVVYVEAPLPKVTENLVNGEGCIKLPITRISLWGRISEIFKRPGSDFFLHISLRLLI